ncbi:MULTISPECIES: MFS transporter [unclassified Nonomuraea]
MRPRSWIPPTGPQRVLVAATFVNAVGRGAYLTAGVLYFTQALHLPAHQVGAALSVAGLLSLAAGPPSGHLADRIGGRGLYIVTLLCGGLATAAFVMATEFWGLLAAACASACASTAGLAARGPLIAHHSPDRPQEFRGRLRSVSNIGISIGTLPAGWAVQVGTRPAYVALILAAAATFLCAAAIVAFLPPTPPVPAHNGPRWIALRDIPYVTLTVLDGLMAVQFKVLTIAVPLWIVAATSAPHWLISATMLVNTAIVGLFQARTARGVDTPAAAGRAMRRAGTTFLISCTMIALAAGMPPWAAAAMLLAGVVVHTVGELWHAAGGFELSFALAPPHAIGQYQGLFSMGMGGSEFVGPALVTALCIEWGQGGWVVLGIALAAVGLLVPPAARLAGRRVAPATESSLQAAR